MADERIENLGAGIRVVVSDSHAFGTDAILLANFTSPKRRERACDLGTGCGIIPLLWCRNTPAEKISAVEIQEQGYLQSLKSVEISGVGDRVTVYNHDLKKIKEILPHASMDVVSMNPPYKAENSGIRSAGKAEMLARHEVGCNIDDVARAAAHLLKFSGRLCLCNRPERLSDTIIAMKKYAIEPKRLRFVVKNAESKPWLFMIEGTLGGKPYMTVEPMLIMYDCDGNISEEVNRIYGDYKEKD